MSKTSVPWNYSSTPSFKKWQWNTEHFEAVIRFIADGGQYIGMVTDLTSGSPRVIHDEISFSYERAEEGVLEFIGKSYPLRLGYRKFAGDLAATFTIGTNHRVNLAPLENTKVQLVARTDNGQTTLISGELHIESHSIVIWQANGERKKVPAGWIQEIRDLRGMPVKELSGTGTRSVKGDVRPGCTGNLGYFPGTVDHSPSAAWCPIHEV